MSLAKKVDAVAATWNNGFIIETAPVYRCRLGRKKVPYIGLTDEQRTKLVNCGLVFDGDTSPNYQGTFEGSLPRGFSLRAETPDNWPDHYRVPQSWWNGGNQWFRATDLAAYITNNRPPQDDDSINCVLLRQIILVAAEL